MARLSRAQIKEIKSIIEEHMDVLMYITTGDGTPSPQLLKKLKLPKEIVDVVNTAYKYGKASTLAGKDLSTMSKEDVNKLIRELRLTPAQKRSIESAKMRAQQSIDTLTQRIVSGVITPAIQSDMQMWEAIKEIIPAAMENDTPRYKVIQQLREKTGDYQRDWHRTAHTEMWTAKCQGEVDAILNGESPLSKNKGDTMVFIRPAPDACNKCKQLYLEKDGVTPKVFKLAELLANGNNYGKKQADWKACVPCLHPNCRCVLNVLPDGASFDSAGNMVFNFD